MPDRAVPEPARRRPLSQADRDMLWVMTLAFQPSELDALPDRELLDVRAAARGRLVDAQNSPAPLGRSYPLAVDALEALAHGQALADRLLAQRWVDARDALRYGAEVRTVARALGLDDDEIRAGLRSWAGGQLDLHHASDRTLGLDDAQHDEVLTLVQDDQR